jgi:hypothetical protein
MKCIHFCPTLKTKQKFQLIVDKNEIKIKYSFYKKRMFCIQKLKNLAFKIFLSDKCLNVLKKIKEKSLHSFHIKVRNQKIYQFLLNFIDFDTKISTINVKFWAHLNNLRKKL